MITNMKKKIEKKGYMRTLEAFFAFFITFIFVVFVVLKGIGAAPGHDPLDILPALEQREDFRTCVHAENTTCIELLADPFIPGTYDHKISIGAPEPFKGAKNIYTETVFVVGNTTNNYVIVYLYYWPKSG